ncbi:sulfotransferase family protein [Haloglycomyces albus]|uniref:sulfotransferase family protein n=1 Tax=Haloglycomyces albus TaxID=526067 RepID=UPI00046CAF63|nr:sulfotransferase [Haloglycomyces albus]
MRRITNTAKFLNTVLSPFTKARQDPDKASRAWYESVDKLVESTGYSIDDDQAFVDDFDFLLRCFASTPGLTPIGWKGQLDGAVSRLENRLRVRQLHRDNPAIRDEVIERPVFVVGLPRTATSLTHKILARSDGHRGPLLWELQYTSLDLDEVERHRRIKSIQRQLDATFKFSPAFDIIHPVRIDQPEESLALLPHTYFHLSCALMEDYREWLTQRDLTEDYQYLKEALQVLQHGRQPQRWILKYPGHVADLDVIFRTFPDATIVWTHRDPMTVMGSFCSLVETLGGLHVKDIDRHHIGRMWLDVLSESVNEGRRHRPNAPRGGIIDVGYHQLVSDPQNYVPELYRKLGANWTREDSNKLDRLTDRPIRDRRHEYDIFRYGLEPQQIEKAFQDYLPLVHQVNG